VIANPKGYLDLAMKKIKKCIEICWFFSCEVDDVVLGFRQNY